MSTSGSILTFASRFGDTVANIRIRKPLANLSC
jgi:hypothetical protein